MRNFIIISLLFIGVQCMAQDTYFQKSSPEMKKEAIKITDTYNLQLALSGKQKLLFQQKVEEFLIRRNQIEKALSGKEKLNYLLDMQLEETDEMMDILTRPQLAVYKKAKPQIQPLETVSKE